MSGLGVGRVCGGAVPADIETVLVVTKGLGYVTNLHANCAEFDRRDPQSALGLRVARVRIGQLLAQGKAFLEMRERLVHLPRLKD